MATDSHTASAEGEPTAKDVYDRVLATIAHNTSEAQRPSTPVTQLLTILAGQYGRLDADAVRGALRAAERRGDILRWRGRDGRPRVCLVEDETLLRLTEYEADQPHPNAELVQRCNRLRDDTRYPKDE